MGCGPTAAVNSFIFLQNKYPDIYDHKLVASDSQADMVKVVDDLIDLDKGYMVTDCKADGTYYAAFITGKQKYIEDKVPGKTVYNARVWFAWDTALGGDKPAYVTDQTAPTAAWMLKEVQDGEDVEILLDSTGFQHYVTVTGFTWFDANDDGKVDPGEYSIDFVDPKGGKDVEAVLILMSVHGETNYPGPSREAAEAFGVGSQAGQAVLQLLDDRVQVVEHPVRKLFFTQFIPDMFLRVQLGRVRRQRQQPDVFRDDQFLGFVRTGPVQHHHDEIGRVSPADLNEELAHSRRIHLAAQPPIQLALQRTDRAVHIDELPLVAVADHGPQGRRCPAPPGSHHASKPGLVLKHQAHRTAHGQIGCQQGSQRFREFFFQSAWAAGSLLGWRVSGATLRHPCRANRRYTTEAATFFRPSVSARAARSGDTTNTPALRACSAQGARNAFSASSVMMARLRPPHLREDRAG
jgi:hypothetical protein